MTPSPAVAIVDYWSGNLRSAEKAFQRASSDPSSIMVTADPDIVANADRIVLPGVGSFADCRAGLDAVSGMVDAITDAVLARARPFFGICVGAQLMATKGLEKTDTDGFGWVPGVVSRISPRDPALKVPHMGWNTLTGSGHPMLDGIDLGPDGLHAYFVHSYHVDAENADHVLATTDYSGPVTAMIGRDTMIGTQFHPEKSQTLGLKLIENFLRWAP
ncbi:MAG: imidazole glycerol phosphate synthase subunit HisH [Pseudomonadota bacterium]